MIHGAGILIQGRGQSQNGHRVYNAYDNIHGL